MSGLDQIKRLDRSKRIITNRSERIREIRADRREHIR